MYFTVSDVDKEHTDIMEKALHAYHEHTEKKGNLQYKTPTNVRPKSAHIIPTANHYSQQSSPAVAPRPGSAKTFVAMHAKPRGSHKKIAAKFDQTQLSATKLKPDVAHLKRTSISSRCNSAMASLEDINVRPSNGKLFTEVNKRPCSAQRNQEDNSHGPNDTIQKPSVGSSNSSATKILNGGPSSAYNTPVKDVRCASKSVTVKTRPFSAHTSIVHPRPDSPNARLAVVMPGASSSTHAKQMYMKAHRPHSGNIKKTRNSSLFHSVDARPKGESTINPLLDETSPSHPYHSLHSPRVRTVAYSDMSLDSDVISVVGMANNVVMER